MPQLDLTTYSTLAFYSFLGFNFIYIFISLYLLPKLSFIFKFRHYYLTLSAAKTNSTEVKVNTDLYTFFLGNILTKKKIITDEVEEFVLETETTQKNEN